MKLLIHKFNSFCANVIKHISYYLFVHKGLNRVMSMWYCLNNKILNRISLSVFGVVSHKIYAESHETSSIDCIMPQRQGYSSNLIFENEKSDRRLISLSLPDLYMARHKNVRIQGNSDFILDSYNQLIINDFCYNMDSRFEFFDGILLNQKRNMVILRYDNCHVDRRLDSGIMLSGRFSGNYYHQVYELQIKLLLLDKIDIPADVPLIIDEVVMKIASFRQIFEALNCTDREVITIRSKEVIEFQRLYCFSAVNVMPPHFIRIESCKASDIVFDLALTMKMRERLLPLKSGNEFPKRIFLTRKNTSLRKYNESEVFGVLKQYGFEQVAPEEYSLQDQIALFNGAEYIVGGTGAAFTNVLFCNEGCKLICIQSLRTNIPIFTTIAYSIGVDMRYCLAKTYKKSIHADYCVNIGELIKIMDCETSN